LASSGGKILGLVKLCGCLSNILR